ncbi:hypothetical protein HPB47_019912, partial [Ixodes persulcatus]
SSRESPKAKRARAGATVLQEAIERSQVAHLEQMQDILVQFFNDLIAKLLTAPVSSFFIKRVNSQCVMFLRIETKESPYVKHSVTFHSNLSGTMSFGAVAIKTQPSGGVVPEVLSDLGTLFVLLHESEQVSSHSENQSLPTKMAALNIISSLLQDIIADGSYHSLLYTHKSWQFDDGAIECPVAGMEREHLVAQIIKEPFLE